MPIQYVFFDCDSTLVQIEGIVELARLKGKAEEIATVTEQAMSGQIELSGCLASVWKSCNQVFET